jgi:vanillate/3-O-methylgallate O-demethylase
MDKPTTGSLQQLLDSVPNIVEYLRNEVTSQHFSRAAAAGKTTQFTPLAFTNWRDEQRSWSEGTALFHQSHHMPELFLEGPDALRLLERVGINTVANWDISRAKQFIGCTPSGHVIGDCIAYRHGEHTFELVSGMALLNWIEFQANVADYDVSIVREAPSNLNPGARRTKYRFQLDGPTAGDVFAAAIDGDLPELKFFRTATVTIKGREVLVLRHGMAGHQGVELSGPFDDEQAVRAAILEAGRDHGIVPVGTAAYFSTSLSNAWLAFPVPPVFTGEELRAYREWLPGDSWEAHSELGGSFVSPNIEDYYATPYDLGYGHVVKFDHDFIGRVALESMPEERKGQKVCLVWDHEDVLKVYASQFASWPRYKSIEMPVATYAFHQFDEVRNEAADFVGVSRHAAYISQEGEQLSLAVLNAAHAVPGTRVSLTWGEPGGGSRKPQVERHEQTTIRATVAPAPYSAAVRESFRLGVGADASR